MVRKLITIILRGIWPELFSSCHPYSLTAPASALKNKISIIFDLESIWCVTLSLGICALGSLILSIVKNCISIVLYTKMVRWEAIKTCVSLLIAIWKRGVCIIKTHITVILYKLKVPSVRWKNIIIIWLSKYLSFSLYFVALHFRNKFIIKDILLKNSK